MKGQQEALTVILISGILIGVVGSVYFWGLPLIQKNKDISILESAESFMKNLNEKIKYVASNGGRDQVKITIPGTMKFIKDEDKPLQLVISTSGTIYNAGAEIPLGRNAECAITNGVWGLNDMEVICVKCEKFSDASYKTTYYIGYRNLESGEKTYSISLDGDTSSAGEEHFIVIENKGTTTSEDGTLINTIIEISIV